MKYIEAGIGNRWWLRTEIEHADGTEEERRGAVGPIRIRSLYVRLWIGRRVYILDTRDGWKSGRKRQKRFKLVLGLCGFME
ncbi:DUF3977 family protein [Paenibacillus sp. B01]|uniref:DUF3977 family protein n=1 Tax=Paenibacillus sp. B01 TaxID=2660554 RepID=UPI00129B8B67|nr:DUF3977 family protein [Paenibacillus sp. B01]QGG54473.1 DUF3977 family protein [Paenibacillus sp. B01]